MSILIPNKFYKYQSYYYYYKNAYQCNNAARVTNWCTNNDQVILNENDKKRKTATASPLHFFADFVNVKQTFNSCLWKKSTHAGSYWQKGISNASSSTNKQTLILIVVVIGIVIVIVITIIIISIMLMSSSSSSALMLNNQRHQYKKYNITSLKHQHQEQQAVTWLGWAVIVCLAVRNYSGIHIQANRQASRQAGSQQAILHKNHLNIITNMMFNNQQFFHFINTKSKQTNKHTHGNSLLYYQA